MKKAWFSCDPESGIQRDEFGGTHVYERSGKTLAEESPERYWQSPIYLAWMLSAVDFQRNMVCRLIAKHKSD